MENSEFYKWFDSISSKLEVRKNSFSQIFKYLDNMPDPIIIVETGCLRIKNNYSDGQSTLLFDKYTQFRSKSSKVYTVDIDANATKVCSENVSKNVSITTADSVKYLNNLSRQFIENKTNVALFYLDSFDCDWKSPEQSAQHHLKELVSIKKILNNQTLVVVDDSPIIGYLHQSKVKKDSLELIKPGLVPGPTISGKGGLVHEYAVHTGAKILFSNYQTGWIGFN
tara:strand:+ start:1015 stop:1689 length:675 start_codon:yes stop_codon:yes gene_type:complete